MRLSARKVLIGLAALSVCLVIGHLGTQSLRYVWGYQTQLGLERLLNLDGEHNLPAWFSSLLLLLASLLLTVTWRLSLRSDDRAAPYWLGLAAIFLYLATDEATMIHETIVEGLVRSIPGLDTSAYLYYPWVLAGAVFVLVVGMIYLRFLLALPARTRLGFVLAGGLYVGGALGVDLLEANLDYLQGGKLSLKYAMLVAIEEGLELAGILTFLTVLTSHLEARFGPVPLVLVGSESAAVEERAILPAPSGRSGDHGRRPTRVAAGR